MDDDVDKAQNDLNYYNDQVAELESELDDAKENRAEAADALESAASAKAEESRNDDTSSGGGLF